MKRNSMSVSVDAAIKAWCLRPPSDLSLTQQIHQHSAAHGISATGLSNALRREKLIPERKPRNPPQA